MDPNAACGASGGTYATTTGTCTGARCNTGAICLSADASLSCFDLAQVCAETVGTVYTVVTCNDGGACPPLMLCNAQNTCVPDCSQLNAG